jgi:hypothetical protein
VAGPGTKKTLSKCIISLHDIAACLAYLCANVFGNIDYLI